METKFLCLHIVCKCESNQLKRTFYTLLINITTRMLHHKLLEENEEENTCRNKDNGEGKHIIVYNLLFNWLHMCVASFTYMSINHICRRRNIDIRFTVQYKGVHLCTIVLVGNFFFQCSRKQTQLIITFTCISLMYHLLPLKCYSYARHNVWKYQ